MSKHIIITGAYDTGKSSTLEYLRDHHNLDVEFESAKKVFEELGERFQGHNLNKKLEKIEKENHLCPYCTPKDFFDLLLEKQLEVEESKKPLIIERGILCLIENYKRLTNEEVEISQVSYSKVFILQVNSKYQVPKWGKTSEERFQEGIEINQNLFKLYTNQGIETKLINQDDISDIANQILKNI